MNLGLKKGTVKLVTHDNTWKKIFEKEEKLIKKNFGNLVLGIEHIGSTSIDGILAKPIIDINIGVKSTKDFQKSTNILENIGYVRIKNKNAPHVHLIFAKGSKKLGTTHYLHLIKYKGAIYNHDIYFRDYLRTHKTTAKQYAELKKKLEKKYPNNRMAYTKDKQSFFEKISKNIIKN